MFQQMEEFTVLSLAELEVKQVFLAATEDKHSPRIQLIRKVISIRRREADRKGIILCPYLFSFQYLFC